MLLTYVIFECAQPVTKDIVRDGQHWQRSRIILQT